VYVPAASPVIVWLPLAVVLLRPGPLTETEVALALVQEIVVVPGAMVLVGLAPIEPVTFGADALTVTVAVCVAGPFGPWAVMV
jgi:hypothetical protein